MMRGIERNGTPGQVQRSEDGRSPRPNHSNSQGEAGELRTEEKALSIGTLGTDSEGRTIAKLLIFTGGILGRLESQIAERRSEAVECVQWYEREIEKCDHELEELRKLRDGLSE